MMSLSACFRFAPFYFQNPVLYLDFLFSPRVISLLKTVKFCVGQYYYFLPKHNSHFVMSSLSSLVVSRYLESFLNNIWIMYFPRVGKREYSGRWTILCHSALQSLKLFVESNVSKQSNAIKWKLLSL